MYHNEQYRLRPEKYEGIMPDFMAPIEVAFKPASDCVVAAQYGIIRYMNPAAERLLGTRTGEKLDSVLGQGMSALADGGEAEAWAAGMQVRIRAAVCGEISIYYVSPLEPQPGDAAQPGEDSGIALRDTLSALRSASRSLLMAAGGEGASAEGVSRDMAAVVAQCSDRLCRMLLGRMDLNDLTSRRVSPKPVHVNAGRLCRELVSTVGYFAAPRGLNVVFAGDADAPGTFDPGLVERAMLHLVSNSLLHMGEGCTLTIGASCSGGYTVLTVDDNGGGLSDESKAHMYDGAHLGLRYAGAVSALHNGSLMIEGRSGHGTHARMVLPYVPERFTELSSPELPPLDGGMPLVMTMLSTWLRPSDYDPRLFD